MNYLSESPVLSALIKYLEEGNDSLKNDKNLENLIDQANQLLIANLVPVSKSFRAILGENIPIQTRSAGAIAPADFLRQHLLPNLEVYAQWVKKNKNLSNFEKAERFLNISEDYQRVLMERENLNVELPKSYKNIDKMLVKLRRSISERMVTIRSRSRYLRYSDYLNLLNIWAYFFTPNSDKVTRLRISYIPIDAYILDKSGCAKPTQEDARKLNDKRDGYLRNIKRINNYLMDGLDNEEFFSWSLNKLKVWAENYNRAELQSAVLEAKEKAEKKLDALSNRFLFEQGVFVISQFSLGEGARPDVNIKEIGSLPIIADYKHYDKLPTRESLSSNISQILDYADRYSDLTKICYLVVYISAGNSRLEIEDQPRYVNGKILHILPILITKTPASALGKSVTYSLNNL